MLENYQNRQKKQTNLRLTGRTYRGPRCSDNLFRLFSDKLFEGQLRVFVRVSGEFQKSCRNRCLIEPMTMFLPVVGGEV